MTPQESLEQLKGPVAEAYPLGVMVDRIAQPKAGSAGQASPATTSPEA
jgi:hypothetical protein